MELLNKYRVYKLLNKYLTNPNLLVFAMAKTTRVALNYL